MDIGNLFTGIGNSFSAISKYNINVLLTPHTFLIALLVVIEKVLPLNHKDVGMRCNEGPNVWSYHWHLAESVVVLIVSVSEWNLRRLIQHWSEASQTQTHTMQSH